MILPISNFNWKNINFGADKSGEKTANYDHDTLLKNNFVTRSRIELDKLTKSFSLYPARGLAGNKNANFYEFLSMGTVPYIIGSLTLMSIFNSANKHFNPFAKAKAAKLGNKMALGVLLYGVFKSVSKSFINIPVKMATGIDTELPYVKINYLLQENPNDYNNLTSIEYHKVGESVDFPRWDQLYGDPAKGEPANWRYDKIAKKNGLGENLNDSDQEVKPIYKEVLVKSKFAKSISSYLWAATGVALAFQQPWENYFRVATLKFWNIKDFAKSIKTFGKSFVKSAEQLYKGDINATSKLSKHSGKILLGAAVASTVLGVMNTIHLSSKPHKQDPKKVMNPSKESVVN